MEPAALSAASVDGQDTFARVKADLAWLRRVVTVPLWLVALK